MILFMFCSNHNIYIYIHIRPCYDLVMKCDLCVLLYGTIYLLFNWKPLFLLYIDKPVLPYRYNVAIKCATITPGTNG